MGAQPGRWEPGASLAARVERSIGRSRKESDVKKVKLEDVQPYQAPGHFGMVALRLHGKAETGAQRFWMGLSHFLPGGGADFDTNPLEKIYFVLDGEVTVKTADQEVTLGPMDSIYLPPNEGREIVNRTNKPASMLVVINYPDES